MFSFFLCTLFPSFWNVQLMACALSDQLNLLSSSQWLAVEEAEEEDVAEEGDVEEVDPGDEFCFVFYLSFFQCVQDFFLFFPIWKYWFIFLLYIKLNFFEKCFLSISELIDCVSGNMLWRNVACFMMFLFSSFYWN